MHLALPTAGLQMLEARMHWASSSALDLIASALLWFLQNLVSTLCGCNTAAGALTPTCVRPQVSESAKLQSQTSSLMRAMDAFNEAIMLVDMEPEHWTIMFTNDAWLRLMSEAPRPFACPLVLCLPDIRSNADRGRHFQMRLSLAQWCTCCAHCGCS